MKVGNIVQMKVDLSDNIFKSSDMKMLVVGIVGLKTMGEANKTIPHQWLHSVLFILL